jgi:ABC-type multidrug transport system fused ATPase/permease subunit
MAAQGLVVASSYTLSNWSSNEENYEKELESDESSIHPKRNDYYKLYLILSSLAILFQILRTKFFYAMCLYLSKLFHSMLLNRILSAKIRFFDLNPVGRILNRFAKDIETLDDLIPSDLFSFLQFGMIVIGSIVISIVINYIIIFSLVPVIVVFIFIRKRFMASSIEIKRIESISEFIYAEAYKLKILCLFKF